MAITPQHIKDWLGRQDSYEYSPAPGTIKVVRDPQVPGTFAVQFEDDGERSRDDGETIQLLFVTAREPGSPHQVLERTLEEVEYDSWPPESGSLKFFW